MDGEAAWASSCNLYHLQVKIVVRHVLMLRLISRKNMPVFLSCMESLTVAFWAVPALSDIVDFLTPWPISTFKPGNGGKILATPYLPLS